MHYNNRTYDDNRSPHWRRLGDERRVNEVEGGRWSNMIANRHIGGPDRTPAQPVTEFRPEPALSIGFTVHLSFGAASLGDARERAVQYAEALSILRTEIAIGHTRLSYADAWHRAERLFCGAAGPDGEICADVRGHPGFHHAEGLGGLAWGDGDIDSDPETGRR